MCPLSLPADRLHPHGGRQLGNPQAHPAGPVEKGSPLSPACTNQENPAVLGVLLWRPPGCWRLLLVGAVTLLHVLPLETHKPVACLQVRWEWTPPGRASRFPYSPCCALHASWEKGQLSSRLRGKPSWEMSPEGPVLGGSGDVRSWLDRECSRQALRIHSPPLVISSREVHLGSWVDAEQKGYFLLPLPCFPWGALQEQLPVSMHSAPPTCQVPAYSCETAINIPTLQKRKGGSERLVDTLVLT